MDEKNIKIAIVDNSIDPKIYNPVKHWKAFLNVRWEAFRAKEGALPNLDEGFSHVILTGSEASIVERENWVYQEIDFVRKAMEKKLPILGSCYGHQLLAITLAGNSCVRRCDRPEAGWLPIQITRKSELLGNKGIFYAFAVHFDEVVRPGNDFKILATTEYCSIHAYQYRDQPIWGIQAHPEINVVEGQELLENLIALKTEATSFYKEALASTKKDSGLIHRIVDCFVQN